MKNRLSIIGWLLLAICSVLGACANKELERKLEGTWVCEEYDYEDGVTTKLVMIESYSLEDHRFVSEVSAEITSPMYMNIGTITYSGTWSTMGDKVFNEVDKNSIQTRLNNRLSKSEQRQMKNEMLRELKKNDYTEGMTIKSIKEDSFVAVDDDGARFEYHRLDHSF